MATNIAKGKERIISVHTVNGKKYVHKLLEDVLDFGFLLEEEVSRRMIDCDQIYTVEKHIETGDNISVVSEYVDGHDFAALIHRLSEQQLYSLVSQVLLLIYLLHLAGISHNDLHCSNIRVQSTPKPVLHYFCQGRTYAVKTFGVKAVIIDFGTALLIDIDRPMPVTSSLLSADLFYRLDIRYDMCRFLKSFYDCLQWRKGTMNCVPLQKILKRELIDPLYLGLYGLPEEFLHMTPKFFMGYLTKEKGLANPPAIIGALCHLFNMWPPSRNRLAKNPKDAERAIQKLRKMDYDGLKSLKNYVLYGEDSRLAKDVEPVVDYWREFMVRYKTSITPKIEAFFMRSRIQDPIFVVDWIQSLTILQRIKKSTPIVGTKAE